MKLHPLLMRLLEHHGAELITPESIDAFVASPGEHVLFFSGDPVRFPEALDVAVVLPEDGEVRLAAIAEADPELKARWSERFPFPLTREYMHGVAILDGKLVDVPDAREAPPGLEAGCRNFLASGYRAATMMPMMRGGQAIGAVSVLRQEAGPLSDRQLAVLRTFADQAVIAIENVRLLKETTEALEQQKASGEVLTAISSSIADAQPVNPAPSLRVNVIRPVGSPSRSIGTAATVRNRPSSARSWRWYSASESTSATCTTWRSRRARPVIESRPGRSGWSRSRFRNGESVP